MHRFILIVTLAIFSVSCSVEPRPINYGSDECEFCMMKIMDARFGAEIVTDKGKVYKFDSAECLLRYLDESKVNSEYLLVTHINEPNVLASAKESFYVVSKNIPSPMGGNLSSYANKDLALQVVEQSGGEIYSWEEILVKFKD